jgi:hypothetical protein
MFDNKIDYIKKCEYKLDDADKKLKFKYNLLIDQETK